MRVALATLTTLALFGVAACGSDDEGSGGGDTDPLKFPDQTRTASLDFSNAAAQYLVTVWSTPGISEASPSADITYELGAGAATSGLRIASVGAKHASAEASSYWNARIAFEAQRRAAIAKWSVNAATSGAPFVKSEAVQAAVCAQAGCTQQYKFDGQNRTFNYVGTITGDVTVTVLTDSTTAVASDLMTAASEFGVAAKKDLRVMGPSGHTGALDADGSGSITVVFTDNFGSIPSDVIGAFIFEDILASGSQANGNHADILWARTPGALTPNDLIIGTLAHEYQHLVSFALRSSLGDPVASREVLWLDEGISHLMEDLTGWGGSTVDAYAQALGNWNSAAFAGPDDSVAQRGKAYMLLRYLVDKRAKERGASDAKADSVLDAAHDIIGPMYTQTRAGFTHGVLQDARNDGRVRDWLRAVYATGNTSVTQSGIASFLSTASSPNSNDQLIGFNPFGDYKTAKGEDVPLAGPDTDDDDSGVSSAIEDSVVSSGQHYYIVSGGEGTVALKLTADANSDINVDAVRIQ